MLGWSYLPIGRSCVLCEAPDPRAAGGCSPSSGLPIPGVSSFNVLATILFLSMVHTRRSYSDRHPRPHSQLALTAQVPQRLHECDGLGTLTLTSSKDRKALRLAVCSSLHARHSDKFLNPCRGLSLAATCALQDSNIRCLPHGPRRWCHCGRLCICA